MIVRKKLRIQETHRMDPGRTALLVIDMQRSFLDPRSSLFVPTAGETVPVIKDLITTCRGLDVPVIYTQFAASPEIPTLRKDPFGPEHLPPEEGRLTGWGHPSGNSNIGMTGPESPDIIEELKPLPGEAAMWRKRAERYSRLIGERKTDRNVHDLGFLFWSTFKRWYDLTGDESLKEVVLTAGKTMGLRFKERGESLRSFVAEDSLFIDIMMNVGVVFYAAIETGDAELLSKAHRHCLTTRRRLVRGDGSTAHAGIFDLKTGEFLRQTTHQGYRGDSAWARGLTWALYGFAAAYKMTGERAYLDTSRLCARFYLEHTDFAGEAPGVPPNDYDGPPPHTLYDSSAAAIAACGLFELAELTGDELHSALYRDAALTIVHTLSGPAFLGETEPGWEGILRHGIYHIGKDLGVDESVMWGEYFFVEALDRALALLERQK